MSNWVRAPGVAPGLAVCLVWALAVRPAAAAPPAKHDEPARTQDGSPPAADPARPRPPPARAANAGVLVLAHLAGHDDARRRVADRLAGALSPAPSVSASNGFVIGIADDVEAAIAWSLERLVPERAGRLEDPFALDRRRPPFAGRLAPDVAAGDDVVLLAVEIATVGVDGLVQAIDTPHLLAAAPDGGATPKADAASRLALDIASIGPPRAPLFAAPSPAIPPVDEAHAITLGGDEVLVFGQRDLCQAADDTRPTPSICSRWLQIVVRSRGRLLAGWMPAAWVNPITGVAPRDAARDVPPAAGAEGLEGGADADGGATGSGTTARRRVRPSHVSRGAAHFVVLHDASPVGRGQQRHVAGPLRDLAVPTRDDGGYPRVTLERDGDTWVSRSPDGLVRRVELDAPIPVHD